MNRTSCALVAAALLGAALPHPALGYSYLDQVYGTPELGVSPRSRAMGGAGAVLGNGAWSLVDNPAAMASQSGTLLQFDLSAARASEDRFVPLFDTFDSYVTETAIAVNDDAYGSVQGGLIFDEWQKIGLKVAAGVYTRYDPRYNYEDEVRVNSSGNNRDRIANQLFMSTEGVLRTLSVGAALPIADRFGVGAGVNYYFGDIRSKSSLAVSIPLNGGPQASTSEELRRDLDGFSVTVGATGKVDERLDLGVSLETAPNLDDSAVYLQDGEQVDIPGGNSGDLKLPLRAQGGLAFRPRNTYRTTFVFDAVYQPWTKTKDHIVDAQAEEDQLLLQDTWDLRFGLEHVFHNDFAGRIGFRYAQAYTQDEADRATFTFGIGHKVERFAVDVSGEVGKRSTRQDPLRPRPVQEGAVGTGRDRVEDTLVRVFLGVQFGL